MQKLMLPLRRGRSVWLRCSDQRPSSNADGRISFVQPRSVVSSRSGGDFQIDCSTSAEDSSTRVEPQVLQAPPPLAGCQHLMIGASAVDAAHHHMQGVDDRPPASFGAAAAAGLIDRVIGEDGDRTFRFGQRAQHLGRSVDFEDLGFTLVELRIAALQIVAHLVRLDCLTVQNAVDRARRELGQAGMPRQRASSASVYGAY